jgi:Ser/Thr protein kinase RdoA (MazF antagonist)
LASGRTAEIYPWDDGRILKLHRAGSARSEALRELVVNRRVTDVGIPAPRVFEGDAADGLVEVGDRVGILFERVDGPSMLADLATHPWRLTHHARTLAELHARMHDHEVTGAQLDDQKARLAKAISASARMTPEIDAASVVRILDKLPGGNRVCHGDVHPDNLVLVGGGSGAKAVALDWENATQGDPAADVARTVLILMLASGTPESSLWERVLARVFGRCFLRVYLSAYLRRSRCGVTRTAIDAWLPVQAAARLAEQIPGERTSLLKLIADRDHIAG